jgi:outer membrane protein insertion porin family/translocation and assembly module TamA
MPRVRACALAIPLLCAALTLAACREEGEIQISSLEFEGVSQVDKGALAAALRTRRGSWLPWGRKTFFDRREFEDDLKRIVAFYHDRGFPDARVASIDLEPNEAQDKIDITVRITEGEPIVVDEVVFEGFDVLPERQYRRLRRELPIKEEMPLDRQLAATARERAVNTFRDYGFPYAEVRLINEPVEGRRERVVLLATPGTLAHFGPVELNGQASVSDSVIRRNLTFDEGDQFSRQKMRDTQQQLYRMELFQFVNVESVEDKSGQPAELPVRITVAEGKHRKLNFGVGYGSEEHLRGRIRWDHVNFFGGARHLGLEGRWSSLDRGVRANFREPFFFNKRLSFNIEGQSWFASEPVYSQRTVGGRFSVRYDSSSRQFLSVGMINEYQTSTIEDEALNDPTIWDDLISLGLDPRDDGRSSGRVSAVYADFSRNTTNNILDARRGYIINAHIEQAGGWLSGDYHYLNLTLEGRYFMTIARRFIWANRINIGALDPNDNLDANIPFHKRFFVGGANSNRGWGRFQISPMEPNGLPIGGVSMLDGSTEVRFPIAGRLGGVTFLDYGNSWDERWSIKTDDLRYSVGAGLRYQTPIGPARFDFGYQLNPIEGLLIDGEPQKRQWRVHFSIGQAF